jgi:hypothetical protein
MIIKIGKRKLKQVEGSTPDDISFIDTENNKNYSFDEYIELIKKEN